MVIKVEGVEPSHPEPPLKAAADPLAFWLPLYRMKALDLALRGSFANFQPDDIIARAAAFEAYIIDGYDEVPPHVPTVDEQISAVFANLTGSLDGNRV
jgi:hypothetical protein